MRRRPSTLLIALLGVSALTAACGLKQDQLNTLKQSRSDVANNGGLGGTSGSTGDLMTGTTTGGSSSGGSGIGATTGLGGSSSGSTSGIPGTSGTTGTPGTTSGTSGTPGTSGTSGVPVNAKCSTLGQNVPGITPTEIRIGIHAPQTGTGAPLPPSFAQGVQGFWEVPGNNICGRHVVIDFQDDKYTPSSARDVCGPMSRRDFLVIGAAGTDQIQSCATMPDIASKGVPYLSAGVTTNGLTGLSHYFAFSLTYAQQSTLVLQNARNQGLGLKKWAVITSKTDNFKDARDAMEGVLKSAGIAYDDIQVDATNDDQLKTRACQTGASLATKGYDTIFLDTSPGYYLFMAGCVQSGFTGTYTGPGVTMTEVTVAQLLCESNPGIKANFLAPYPGIDRATADFKKKYGTSYDDIYWSLWGLSQVLKQAFDVSPNLTRAGFIQGLKGSSLPGGAYNPIRFNGGHFGGTGAFSQKLNCSKSEPNAGGQPGQWDTVGQPLFK